MVGPEEDFTWRHLALSLPRLPSPPQDGRLEVVVAKHLEGGQGVWRRWRFTNLDAVLDGQVVQLVGHFQLDQVVHCEEVQHPSVHPERCGYDEILEISP